MAIYRCKVCGGVYLDFQPDGSRYFHACAPMHNPAYDAQFSTDAQGKRLPKGPLDPLIPEMIERPNARNENVITLSTGKTAPKAEGPGKDVVK